MCIRDSSNTNDPISRTARILGLVSKYAHKFTELEMSVLQTKIKFLGAEFVKEQIAAEHAARQASAERSAEMFASFCESSLGKKIASTAEMWVSRLDSRGAQFEEANRERRLAFDDREGKIQELHQLIEITRLEKQLEAEKQAPYTQTFTSADEIAKIILSANGADQDKDETSTL